MPLALLAGSLLLHGSHCLLVLACPAHTSVLYGCDVQHVSRWHACARCPVLRAAMWSKLVCKVALLAWLYARAESG